MNNDRIENHTCHALGCKRKCKPEFLMCDYHWSMVPESFKERVWEEYKPGQCDLKPIPSPQWHSAADAAIYLVAFRESKNVIGGLVRQLKENGIKPEYKK